MELVFENGQILAKRQRSNVSLQSQRTKSIVDLYETEYNEDFKKNIHGGGGGDQFIKNLRDTQVVPEHHVVASDGTNMLESNKHVDEPTLIEAMKASSSKRMIVDYENRKNFEFIPPDEQSVVAERSVELGFTSSSTDFTEDSEDSTYLSTSLDDDVRPRVPARTRKAFVKRKRSAQVYNSPKRKQRNDINQRMRTLQDLLPSSHKDNNESLLDEAINYMTTLQHHVQMMAMGNRFVTPSMILPLEAHYSQMGLATGMQMGVPQFLPATVPGSGLPWITNAEHMLRFLNHPGLIPMQSSLLFTPLENHSPQSVPPSCDASPNQIPNSTSVSNLDDATTFRGNQGNP